MAEPAITFGAAQSFGALTGWNEQDSDSDVVSDRYRGLSKDGNQTVSGVYNTRTEVTTSYEAAAASGVVILPAEIGSVTNSLDVTEISVTTSGTALATLSVTAHNHASNAHSTGLNKAVHGFAAMTVGFGAVDFLGGTAGSVADIASSSLTISCEHEDVETSAGAHLVGENYDCKIVASTVWNGVPTTEAAAGWDKVSSKTVTTNKGFLQTTVTGEKSIDMA